MDKKYDFNNKKYIIEKNNGTSFDYETVKEYITDYFIPYDYIFCDIAYNKLRLKGFCNKDNKKYNKINDIGTLDSYINDYCAYNCDWFLLKKVE